MTRQAVAPSAGVQRNQFGAFGGVFTPCILTILGVIMFKRAGFVVGQTGIMGAVLILLLSKAISFSTALSTSAIATNTQVRGGGAYFLISRVLGPEFGGAIGILLYLAQGLSVPFYILGFSEALVDTIPALKPYFPLILYITAGTLFVLTYVGASWVIRLQYFILAILVASIVVFLAGAWLDFSPEIFRSNWMDSFTPIDNDINKENYNFWRTFAIYFPAVTGIMAGINMSGDLKDPAKAIPKGTIYAIAVGFLIYLVQILIMGGAFDRASLVERPYLVLKDNALFGFGFLVAAGVFAATLSSAIGSFMGAPRVLQAAARDRILNVLRPFARGSASGDEPRRAIVLTGLMTFIVLQLSLMLGDKAFNHLAAVLTMFFLYTYAMLNIAAFIEVAGGNPSFRPRFRFFHWSTALAGGIGCVVVAFIINAVAAIVAMVVLAGLVWNIRRRELDAAFGDARRGFVYATVRKNLIRLARMEETSKNWRPTSVVFSGNPDSREALINYAVWLEAGRGIVYLADVLQGDLEDYLPYRNTALRRLEKFCTHRNINAFPVVTIDDSLTKGVKSLMQGLAVGPIRPNVIVLGWTGKADRAPDFTDLLRVGKRLSMSQLIIQPSQRAFYYGPKRIDIWWRGMKNGGLMLLLAHLLTCNWEWSRTKVRVMRLLSDGNAQESALRDLENLIHEARVEAEARVVISDVPFSEVFESESGRADCVFLGFEIPDKGMEAGWHQMYESLMHPDRTTILVTSEGLEDLMA